jgi:hypothetical protein
MGKKVKLSSMLQQFQIRRLVLDKQTIREKIRNKSPRLLGQPFAGVTVGKTKTELTFLKICVRSPCKGSTVLLRKECTA